MLRLITAVIFLLACQFVGETIVRIAHLPIPGALVGMLILTVGLIVLGRVPKALAEVGDVLLRHMMLLLAPAVVALLENFGRVREEWVPFLVACVAGSVITLGVTAVVLQWMLRRSEPLATTSHPGTEESGT